MSCSLLAKLFGILLLLANLPGLAAQQTVSTEETLTRQIAADWKALQTKGLTPEDRIAAVDAWQKAEQPKFETLQQARIQSVRQASAQSAPVATPVPVTELDRINAAIEKEFQPIRDAKHSPEERIRQMDDAMKKTASLQGQRAVILSEEAASAKAEAPANLFTLDQSTPEGRLAAKGREIFEQKKNMTPEARIAAVDATNAEIDSLTREVWAARKAATTPAISTQDKPTK